jgi:hypothetical protein
MELLSDLSFNNFIEWYKNLSPRICAICTRCIEKMGIGLGSLPYDSEATLGAERSADSHQTSSVKNFVPPKLPTSDMHN